MTLYEHGMEIQFALSHLRNCIYFGLGVDLLLDKLDKLLERVVR